MNHKIENDTLFLITQKNLISEDIEIIKDKCKTIINSSTNIKNINIDLTNSNIIDSKGLNLLIGLYQESSKRNYKFKVIGVSEELKKLFSFVKLTEKFGIL